MNRRHFLRALGIGAAGLTLAAAVPEAVLEALAPSVHRTYFDLGGPPRNIADKDVGISIRYVKEFDPNSGLYVARMDLMYGWAALRPELACRISA